MVVLGPESQFSTEFGVSTELGVSTEPGGRAPAPVDNQFANPLTSRWRRLELPTWLVIVAVYGFWLTLTFHAAALPWWLLLAAGGWVMCWHGSLQHEAVHGHPTRSDRINGAIAGLPLGLWMPFAIYRETHLSHHDCPALTDPLRDTESFYVRSEEWQGKGVVRRTILRFNNTLLGRLTVGPALAAITLWKTEIHQMFSGDWTNAGTWVRHILGASLVLAWVALICDLSVWMYVFLFAYPGLSLTLLRSYAEHHPSPDTARRTALVVGSPLSGLLYLNNNLHAVHHSHPGLPWYAIPGEFCARRDAYRSQTGGKVYPGYTTILRRFLFQTRDHPVHPEHRLA